MLKKYILTILLSLAISQNDCLNNRYIDEIFDVDIEYNVQYGQNINQSLLGSQYTEDLYMDIYTPYNDESDNRPLIFFMFGGSFVSGSRSSSDIVALCTKYAKRGYVAVAIDYRLSQHLLLFNPNEENAYKAVMKAVHDVKAAIRYFKMNDELYDDYKIDVNRVFTGGYSAGAVTAINAAYLNEFEELPEFLIDDFDGIGGFEGFSGNPGYSSEFHGIVNLSGAVGSQDWIIQGDIPIVSMHGDQDDTVPYDNSLITLFGLNIAVDGSYIIHDRMLELGNYSALHTYYNQGHAPYSNMAFEAEFSSDFLYEIVCSDNNYLLGDLNFDGIINILDVIVVVNIVLGIQGANDTELVVSDVTQDGLVNILDIITMVNIILDN